MIMCPNLKNPEVAREFNELKEATSELAAYRIWSLNNGNAIDKAPNGAESKLFRDLLDWFSGFSFEDSYARKLAIQAKAKTYSLNFLNWFGDWTNDPTNASKVVDENGEPLVVYHGGSKRIRISKHFIVPHEQEDVVYDVDENGEPLYEPGPEYNLGTFFTTDKQYALIYQYGNNEKLLYPCFLNIKYPGQDDWMSSKSVANAVETNEWVKSDGFQPVDGLIGHDAKTLPGILSNGLEFAVFEANLIKSIYNDGTFSDSDKLYHHKGAALSTNPYEIPKSKSALVVLSEEASENFSKYLQKSRGIYPKEFYDNARGVKYVKSYKNKNSKKYDIVDVATGEIIAQSLIIYTREQWKKLQEVKRSLEDLFTNYNKKRSFAFKKGLITPSKGLFKRMAKTYLLEAIRALQDVAESAINHKVIDDFVDMFDDSIWQHIITYSLNPTGRDTLDSRVFGIATTSFGWVFGGFAFNRTIPKQGLIEEVAKSLGKKPNQLRFTGYVNDTFYKNEIINRNLPYDVLEKMLIQLSEDLSTMSEQYRIEAVAKYEGISVERVREIILKLREEDTVESSKRIRSILYENPATNPVYKALQEYVKQYKQWLNSLGATIPENVVNIIFNRESFAGEDTPIVRLATIMHEPFHALSILFNGSDAYKNVLDAFDKFVSTKYGEKVYNEYVKNNTSYKPEDLQEEFLADLFSLVMMPEQLRALYSEIDSNFLGSSLAKNIFAILDTREYIALPKAVVEQTTEERKAVLPLIKQIYNAIISWLSKYSEFVKNTFKLYDEVVKTTSYERRDTFELALDNTNVNTFKDALQMLSDAMKSLAKELVLDVGNFQTSTLFMKGGEESDSGEELVLDSVDDYVAWTDAIDSEIESCQELKRYLQNEADVWVNEQMHSRVLIDTELARLDLYKEFYRHRVYDAFDEVLYKLKEMFPVKDNKTGRMRQLFLDRLENLGPEKAKLMLTIAYNEIIGVKVENNIRPVVHEYIETFHQSEVIQEALRVLDDGRGLSTPRLIRDLVDIITGEITTGNNKRLLNEFWSKFLSDFNRRMKQVFRWIKKKSGGKVEDDLGLSYSERKTILNDLTKWFLSNEQLHIEENAQCVYDMSKWKVSGKDIIVREKDAIEAIKRGVLSRLKGIKATTSNQTSETEIDFLESWKDALEAIEGSVDREISSRIDSGELDPNNAVQIANAKRDIRKGLQQDEISRFLINGLEEIRRLSQELQEMRAADILFSNFAKLMRMKADIMGFYEIVSSRYIQPYTHNTDNPEFMEGGSLYGQIKAIRNAIGSIKTVYDRQLERYADYIVDRIAEDYIDIGDKDRWADTAKMWLRNKIDGGNLSFLETVTGPAYASTSPIIRIFDMYVREANTAVRQDVLECGKKLNELYDKCEPVVRKLFPGNFMRYFCEMDENGKPTGYFISKYKIGTFLKRREEIRKKLLKEHKVEVDSETGELQFETEEQRIAFEDAYDLARYELGEVRLYRPEYYIARRHALSKDTNALLSQYENQINRLKKGAMVTVEIDGKEIDVFMKNKLSPSARYDYERLQREKDALSNPYEIIFDSAGNITSIKEKEGVAKTRALEIMNWNKWQAKNIQRTPNTVKFNAVREQLVEKYGEDSIEIKQFDFDYTTRRATQDWYDTLMSFAGYTNDSYEELRDKRKALLRAIEYKSGLYTNRYDFDKLNGDALEILRNLEHDLDAAREKTERSDEEIERIRSFFNDRTTQLLFTKSGTNTPYLNYEQKRIEDLFPGDKTKLKELFYDKFFYEDEKGDLYPLSIFSQLSPSLSSDIEENVPTGMFSDVDQLSTFVDDRFDSNEDSSFQIDKGNKEFINDRYDEIMKDKNLKAFYEELLNTMDDAWKQLPNIYRTNRYQMPLRRDRSSHLITRLGSFKAIMSNLFKVNENDVQFNEEFTTHADGTIVETIPVRWVKALQDPTMISTDIVGSVIDFYEMALNFREKQAIAAMGEALKLQTSKTSTGEIETDQSSRLGTYLSMFVYGRMVSGFSRNKTMSNTEKVIAKCLYRLRSLAHSKLMKHNWFGVGKNLKDSTWSLLGEIYGGKHFTIGMFVKALRHMGKEIFTGEAFSFGKTNTRSWTAKAMLFNGVSGTTHELFHNRNESRIRRVLQMTPMIEYTFVDYSFKGCITNMTYDSYKLITNPSTGKKEFMNMELAKYAYSKTGAGRNAGLDAFNKSDITLRDAYTDTGYKFELKPEYLDIVRPYNKDLGRRSRKIEQRVASTIQERSGVINGMLNDIDRGKLNQNYIGALVMLMRGWMVSQMADNIKYGHDFARFSSDANEFIDKKSIKKYLDRTYVNSKLGLDLKDPQMAEEDEDYEGIFNLATGTVDSGVWRNLLRAYVHWVKDLRMFKINLRGLNLGNKNITAQEMYQVKKMNAAIMAVGVTAALTFILGKSLEGDGDNPQWWKLALYSYMVGSISELTTKVGYVGFAPTVMDLVNSLAIAPSTVLEDFDASIKVGSDIISLSIAAMNSFSEEFGQEPLKPVTSGSYSKLPYGIKGNKKIEKAIKAKNGHTPQYIKNILELSSITPGVSDLGIANIVKNMSESGLYSKTDYYISNQFPTKYLVYNAQRSSKPKEQHGLFGMLENFGVIPKQQPKIKPPKLSNKSSNRSSRRSSRRNSRRTSR